MTETSNGLAAARVGVIATRVVTPVWILAGAVAKLLSGSPALLPVVVIKAAGALNLDLIFVLRYAIGVELAAVGLIWLVRRLARPAAVAILGLFLPILVADMFLGATTCGCFGSVQLHPALTLIADGALLAAILLAGRRSRSLRLVPELAMSRVILAILWVLASFALSFGWPMAAAAPAGEAGAAPGPTAAAVQPPHYYLPDYSDWLGRRWDGIDLNRWIQGSAVPSGGGVHFVLFYRKDCEHCHELMEVYFNDGPRWPTTMVAVPEREGFPTVGVQPMACPGCQKAELPAGCDWFLQTPMLVKLVDGVVTCVAEEDPAAPECADW